MISAAELIDELGGIRGITLGSILIVCSYVAASRYVETVEERLADADKRIEELEKKGQRFDALEAARKEWRLEHQIHRTVDDMGADDE